MFDKIIQFSLNNKLLVILGVIILSIMGVFSATKIPLDAVPDITNNQVQIVSTAPTLAPQEMEQLITYPLEAAMTNIPGVVEVRSISRYGLSVITIVFEEDIEVMLARQYVQEQLNIARSELPPGLTEPELMPITTGLGEIYQYVLTVDKEFAHLYDATKLRTIQDWIIKRQLNGTKGIIEVSSFGGYLKQYEVSLNPNLLKVHGLTIPEVIHALEENNQNSGGSYIEKGPYSFYIRTEGRAESIEHINSILVKNRMGIPIKVGDIATVGIGSAKRYGAMTMDGKGEVVGGITLMFKGANSSEVLSNVRDRMEIVEKSLPDGVHIYPYLDRSKLIGKTISTVKTNLIEGGLIVIFVLLLLLGNFRAGLIVASVIPLSMLFALIMMRYFGISANLMSLGAIDFGIVIDGAVIIVEALLHTLTLGYLGKKLSQQEMDQVVRTSTSKIYRSAAFGVLIILVVFIPILTLDGTEGKTFRPMAQTVGFAIIGSLILSLTYVPAMASIFLKKTISEKVNLADKFIAFLQSLYRPALNFSIKSPLFTIGSTILVFLFSILLFMNLGAEFVPTLEEGDIAMQQSIKPGSSLNESIHTSTMAEKILLENFPEVEHVVSKIGTAEVPTDPMAIEDADVMIILKDKEEWTSAKTTQELMDKMKDKLAPITWASFEFTQPIQLRFNELMTGAKSDIAIKIFGEDVEVLKKSADECASIIAGIPGAGDVKVDQTDGLQQLSVKYDRSKLAQHGVNVSEVNQVIRAAYAGEIVGSIFEEERQFDLAVRIASQYRQELDLNNLTINTINGHQLPLSELATISSIEGPMLISREQARRFINIGVNVRDRDIASLVDEIQTDLASSLDLPPGYEIQYGGQFENLENARKRLLLAVPVALFLILLLLYLAFKSVVDAFVIFMAVPLSAVGGILALWLRDMPFSISSGIGFIALFGVSVLNGIVLLSAIKQLKTKDFSDYGTLISSASISRLRPVLMTALVAALGFLPMAISTGSGAEVQRPLATVVIGGLITSTLLTLILLPTLYNVLFKMKWVKQASIILLLVFGGSQFIQAQDLTSPEAIYQFALENHPEIQNQDLEVEKLRLEEKGQFSLSPLELTYKGGQINYSGIDHEFSIDQDISPLLNIKEKKLRRSLLKQNISTFQNQNALSKKQLYTNISLVYNELQHLEALKNELLFIDELQAELNRQITLRKKTGSIDLIEEAFLNADIGAHKIAKLDLELLIMKNTTELKELAFIPDDKSISITELQPLNYSDGESIQDAALGNMYESKKLNLESEIKLTKHLESKKEFNLGYFAQSLENNFLYSGIQLGVSIPIDQRKQKTKVKQLELAKIQLDNEWSQQEAKWLRNIQQRKESIKQMSKLIEENYREEAVSMEKEFLDKINRQLELGDIDYFKYSLLQKKIFEIKQNRLTAIKKLNDEIIHLHFLTQSI